MLITYHIIINRFGFNEHINTINVCAACKRLNEVI